MTGVGRIPDEVPLFADPAPACRERARRERGFTLIELLVVILIIAILAAIAIPVFLKQREKGWTSQVQSALKNGATAAESYATETGSYGGLNGQTLARLMEQGFRPPPNITIEALNGTGGTTNATQFCLQVTHHLLPSSNDWRVATYDSMEGEPATPDTCT